MKVEFDQLGNDTRVWIYQSKEIISGDILEKVKAEIAAFVQQWAAHNQPLAAFGDVFHERFIVLMVDERHNVASGCSIDSSVAFIRHLEGTYGLDLFDRMTFSYEKDQVVYTVPSDRFAELYRAGEINEETLVFDNLVKTKNELLSEWQKPLGNSWLSRFV